MWRRSCAPVMLEEKKGKMVIKEVTRRRRQVTLHPPLTGEQCLAASPRGGDRNKRHHKCSRNWVLVHQETVSSGLLAHRTGSEWVLVLGLEGL